MLAFAILMLILLSPSVALAYLDPGTGAFIIQGLLAAVFGTILTLKLYWRKIVNYFKKNKDTDQ